MEVKEPSALYLPNAQRETEVGPIPVDWEIARLDEITDRERPISYGIVQTGPRVQNGIPCLRVVDIQDGKIRAADLITTTDEISNAYRRTKLRKDDLVVPLRGKVGECAQVTGSLAGANLTRGVALVAVLPKYSASYCRQFFSSSRSRARLNGAMNGSALQEVPIATLRSFKIALPPTFGEQNAIAKALADADALINSLEQLLTKKRQIKQGAMQELLTGKRRLPGFHDAWVPRSMADLFEFSGGLNASRDQLGDAGACYLHYGDIHLSSKTYIDLDLEHHQMPRLEVDVRKVSPTALLQNGDVVFVDASEDDQGVSKHVVIHCRMAMPLISGLHTIVARPRTNELVDLYKRYCFQAPEVHAQFRFYAVGTKVSGVSKGNIGKIVLSIPSPAEQAEIAACLSEIDAEICALEDRLTKARALKQAMAQALLTGRIRLVEPTA